MVLHWPTVRGEAKGSVETRPVVLMFIKLTDLLWVWALVGMLSLVAHLEKPTTGRWLCVGYYLEGG